MTDKKISQLDQLAVGDVVPSADVVPIVDASVGATYKVTAADLVNSVFTSTLTASKPVFTDASKNLVSTGTVSLTSEVAGTLPVANGGTGQTSYTDGQLLIGNSSGNTLAKNTLTAGTGILITNGSGTITIATSGGGTPDFIVQSYGIV